MFAIRDGTVVDADGIREADVLVEDGEVAAVEPGAADDADEEIDADGRYVAPGMIDAHVHLMMDGTAGSGLDDVPPNEYRLAFRATRAAENALNAGITTVRDLGAWGTLTIDTAAAVEDGLVEGPRILPCGQNIVMTGGHGHAFGREADGPHEVRKAVREQIKRGAEVIKCMATGGVMTEGSITAAPELTERELEALVDAADAKSVPTAAHADGLEGIKNAVRAGITSVEHGSHMDREAAAMMADRGTYWVPTVKAYETIIEHRDAPGMPKGAGRKARAAADELAESFGYVAEEDGIPPVMGSDAGTPFNPHEDAADELEWMVEYGLSERTALEAATVNAAELLGLEDVGKVREGYRADLVVLPANPLEDVAAWQDVEHVLKGGDVVR